MNREALIQLRDAVRAGGFLSTNAFAKALPKAPFASRAYEGSLDAAKALHEAVLPGWRYGVGADEHSVWAWVASKTGEARSDGEATPARAWLLAILEALIAEVSAAQFIGGRE